MDGQTENPNCSTISILHENPLHFNVCEQNFSPSTSQNMQISGERERQRERSEDMDQIQNITCCHQGMAFLKNNRKTETELQALHITVRLHTNDFVIASATILLIQSPVLQNQMTRHVVFDWRSLGVMRVYKSSYWFMSNPG